MIGSRLWRRFGNRRSTSRRSRPDEQLSGKAGPLYPALALDTRPARAADHVCVPEAFRSLADVPVTPVTNLARDQNALGQTRDGAIEIDAALSNVPGPALESVVGHELVHVAQQRGHGAAASTGALEREAGNLSNEMRHGDGAWPTLTASPDTTLKQQPDAGHTGRVPSAAELAELNRAFERATAGPSERRQEHLRAQQEYLAHLRRVITERQSIETRRTILDQYNLQQVVVEQLSIGGINRRPLSISVSPDRIQFTVRFHVLFRGTSMDAARQQFPAVQQSLRTGLATVWGQRLSSLPPLVRDREFVLTPLIDLIPENAPRNPDYWLVDIDPAITRSQTDPAAGVMKVSPQAANDPDTLGHESLHLFGLIDRYIDNLATHRSMGFRGSGQPGSSTGVTRGDPLDVGHGAILPEDLEFLFAELDVYEHVILEELTPYHAALMRHMGWGHVPRMRDLLARVRNDPDSARHLRELLDHADTEVQLDLSAEIERQRIRREAAAGNQP